MTVRLERHGELAHLTVSTPSDPYLRAAMVEELRDAALELAGWTVRAVVLVGGHRSYFSAGAAREQLLAASSEGHVTTYAAEIPRLILSIPWPTVAAMAGHAVGGGLVMGLWCDAAVLAEESLYGANFMALGFTPGMGATVVMEEAFGACWGRALLLSGEMVKGRAIRARGCPLSHHVVPREESMVAATSLAHGLGQGEPRAVRLLRRSIAARRLEALEDALAAERAMHAELFDDAATHAAIEDRYARGAR
jgi:enoyl-CoA hydratase/carnithine racemase